MASRHRDCAPRGSIDTATPPAFTRIGISPKHWLELCAHFEDRFKGLVGTQHSLNNLVASFGLTRKANRSNSTLLFCSSKDQLGSRLDKGHKDESQDCLSCLLSGLDPLSLLINCARYASESGFGYPLHPASISHHRVSDPVPLTIRSESR